MILTGKALIAFKEWAEKEHPNEIVELPCGYENTAIWIDSVIGWESNPYLVKIVESLIIEWLDSVGIYLGILVANIDGVVSYLPLEGSMMLGDKSFPTRPEATTQALITANKIYNERN